MFYDANGCFGETLDTAFRLLDAPSVKGARRSSATSTKDVSVCFRGDTPAQHDLTFVIVKEGYPPVPEPPPS